MVFVISYLIGVVIIVAALLLNGFAELVGVKTWYRFIKEKTKNSFLDYLWLFLVYPFSLGIVTVTVWYLLLSL
jgi:uncharacterized membrane protein YidH (DUF202 family)